MRKILSVAVPCYNSEAYMHRCIDSLLPGGDEVEIIIVDDGSGDKTAEIADRYAAEYPGICKAVHKVNGGHGDAVMDLRMQPEYFLRLLTAMTESEKKPI
mgnify:CR=1 FL=1